MQGISLRTATMLVVASMVGTGIFTTTGLLARDLNSGWLILLTWLLGGCLALCGALAYAELCARYPRNGGEYWLLGQVYHPALGFIAGMVSIFVGFAATIAVSADAFARYVTRIFPELSPTGTALGLIIVLTMVNTMRTQRVAVFQDLTTISRYVLTVLVAAFAIIMGWGSSDNPWGGPSAGESDFSARDFAVGLVWVAYAYSGWNAASYVVDELTEPQKTVPRALTYGTALVTGLYALINVTYLVAVPREQMAGVIEVAHVVAEALGGRIAAQLVSAVIALGLISMVGAYTMVGVRIYHVIAADYPRLKWIAPRVSEKRASVRALWIQATIACAFVLSATFEVLLTYVGFTLTLFAALTVAGVFVARKRNPQVKPSYGTWGYPYTPIAFLLIAGWMLVNATLERPLVALAGIGIFVGGAVLYLVVSPTAVHKSPRSRDTP